MGRYKESYPPCIDAKLTFGEKPMTTRTRRPTPTQVRAARRRRQARRKKLLAIFGFSAAGLVAFLLILSLVLPGCRWIPSSAAAAAATSSAEAQLRRKRPKC